jgi:hypothetical protein
MAALTDAQIEALLQEPKPMPADWLLRLRVKPGKIGHNVRDFEVRGGHGSDFRIIVRQSAFNPLDFSVVLGYRPILGPRLFRLRRYNGRSHEHRNRIEGDRFYDFHIHTATERYQLLGMDEDSFANPTDRYGDLSAACQALALDCGFSVAQSPQMSWLDSIQ